MRYWPSALLLFGLVPLAGAASSERGHAQAAGPPASTLMSDFTAEWNRDDAGAVARMFAEDAVVLLEGHEIARGRPQIEEDFIAYNLPVVRDLQITSLAENTGRDVAYQTGTYTQRIEVPGSSPYTQTGRQTFVWKRQGENAWKLTSLLIDPDPAVDLAADRAAIRELDRQWEEAIARRDVDFIANLYAPDGRLMQPNMPSAVGREAVRAAFGGVLSPPDAALIFGDDPEIVVSEAGDMAYEIGTYRYSFTSPQGPVVDEGKYLITWVKTPEGWKVAADMFNSNLPAQ